MKIFGWSLKKNTDAKKNEISRSADTGKFIDSAYSRRSKEIESLRKYDRGEKEIAPSNIRGLSRSV